MIPHFPTDYFKKGTKEIIYIKKNKPVTRVKYIDKIREFLRLGKRREQFLEFIGGHRHEKGRDRH